MKNKFKRFLVWFVYEKCLDDPILVGINTLIFILLSVIFTVLLIAAPLFVLFVIGVTLILFSLIQLIIRLAHKYKEEKEK